MRRADRACKRAEALRAYDVVQRALDPDLARLEEHRQVHELAQDDVNRVELQEAESARAPRLGGPLAEIVVVQRRKPHMQRGDIATLLPRQARFEGAVKGLLDDSAPAPARVENRARGCEVFPRSRRLVRT